MFLCHFDILSSLQHNFYHLDRNGEVSIRLYCLDFSTSLEMT